jgi:hypothetical protein
MIAAAIATMAMVEAATITGSVFPAIPASNLVPINGFALIAAVRRYALEGSTVCTRLLHALARQRSGAYARLRRFWLNHATERRRSRTYRAVGYTTAPVLKTGWATGPMPLHNEG